MMINQQGLNVIATMSQFLPEEGPKVIPLLLNFTTASTITFEAELLQSLGLISMVQTIYIDMKDATVALTVTVGNTNQIIKVKIATQGYYAVLVPNPVNLTFDSAGNTGVVRVFLINTPIAGHNWATA